MEKPCIYGRGVSVFDAHGFGRRVAAARVWAGIEPKELAHRLGISDESIYRMERGERKRPPGRGELGLLAEILGQPDEWLLSGTEPPWNGDRPTGPGADEVLAALNGLRRDLWTRLDAIERELRRRQ